MKIWFRNIPSVYLKKKLFFSVGRIIIGRQNQRTLLSDNRRKRSQESKEANWQWNHVIKKTRQYLTTSHRYLEPDLQSDPSIEQKRKKNGRLISRFINNYRYKLGFIINWYHVSRRRIWWFVVKKSSCFDVRRISDTTMIWKINKSEIKLLSSV